MGEERRKKQRTPAVFTLVLESSNYKHLVKTSDLSVGGCYIDRFAGVNVSEIIKIRLRLPSGEWMHLKGEVIYNNNQSGFGVRFIEVPDIDQRRLDWLVKAEIHRESSKKSV